MQALASSNLASSALLTRENGLWLVLLAEHIRTGYTADNKPVRVMLSIVPGDTLILEYTIPT